MATHELLNSTHIYIYIMSICSSSMMSHSVKRHSYFTSHNYYSSFQKPLVCFLRTLYCFRNQQDAWWPSHSWIITAGSIFNNLKRRTTRKQRSCPHGCSIYMIDIVLLHRAWREIDWSVQSCCVFWQSSVFVITKKLSSCATMSS